MAQRSHRTIPLSWVISITGFFALLIAFGLLGPVQRFGIRLLTPISRVAHRVVEGIRVTVQDRQQSKDVVTENTELKNRLIQVEQEKAALNQQLADLKILRTESAFLSRRSLKGVAVRVIGRSQFNTQRVLVDAGSAQHIQRGAPVLAGDGILVGVVEDTQDATCSIRLLTADSTKIAVRVGDQGGPPGVVIGERGVGMRLTLVPQNEKLEKSLTVITADADPQIPSGILIGTITSIDIAPGALFQSAAILPIIPLDRLNVLTILTSV